MKIDPPADERGEQAPVGEAHAARTHASNACCARASGLRDGGAALDGRRRSRYIASVGTSVRDRMYDASMAKTTASASGTKR